VYQLPTADLPKLMRAPRRRCFPVVPFPPRIRSLHSCALIFNLVTLFFFGTSPSQEAVTGPSPTRPRRDFLPVFLLPTTPRYTSPSFFLLEAATVGFSPERMSVGCLRALVSEIPAPPFELLSDRRSSRLFDPSVLTSWAPEAAQLRGDPSDL